MSASATSATMSAASTATKTGIDPRWFSSSLLTLILVVGQWRFQILGDSYVPWMVALGTALVTELVLWRTLRGGWPNILSAYISGNSIAILVKPDGALLWPFAIGSFLSIACKYTLNYKHRHLWNPTNFGICVLLALASEHVSILSHQWGNEPLMVALIWTVGLLIVWRAKVLHLTLTYLAAFAAFAVLRAQLNGQSIATELAPVTGPMYTLFMFFMVTDPKTIPKGRKVQVLTVLAIAALECVFRILCDREILGTHSPLRFAPALYALFLIGAPVFWWQLRKAPDPALTPARA